jgi:hypothetical protein
LKSIAALGTLLLAALYGLVVPRSTGVGVKSVVLGGSELGAFKLCAS